MVDFTKKIVNSDKFRQSALCFQKHGVYCFSPSGTTEYIKFWDEEMNRCINGYTAPDGDWISGYNYFYLNYCPIQRIVEEEYTDRHGNVKVRRVRRQAFPDFYDYDYYFFQAVQEAEEQGKHLVVLKSRRKGYSFKCGAMMDRNYYLLPESKSYAYAAENEFLIKDGIITKAWEYMDFIDTHTAWGKKRQAVNTKMHRRASILSTDEMGNKVEIGYKSEVIGVTIKNDPQKVRGKAGKLILFEEAGKCFGKGTKVMKADGRIELIENLQIGDKLMGPDGLPRTITHLHNGIDEMYKITPQNGVEQIVNSKHDIYYKERSWYNKTYEAKTITAPEYLERLDKTKRLRDYCSLVKSDKVEFEYKSTPIDPYFLGLWLGDGDSDNTRITSMDSEIKTYLYQFAKENNMQIRETTKPDNKAVRYGLYADYRKNILKDNLRKLGILKQKDIPELYMYNSRDVQLQLLAGLIDTDGSYDKDKKVFEITQKNKSIAEKIVFIARSLGIKTTIRERLMKGYDTIYYRVTLLSNLHLIPTKIQRKQAPKYEKRFLDSLSSKFDITYNGVGEYYGFTLDGDSLFLLEDFTICHNSPHLMDAWQIARPSVEQDGMAYGLMIAFGTGGTEGADFKGLKDMFYHPKGYNCLAFNNIWDEHAEGTECGFFIPQYTNLDVKDEHGVNKYMDIDGNTNTNSARDYVLSLRQEVIDHATESATVDRYVAEQCLTPAEACLELTGNIFPKKELQQQLAKIRVNKKLQSHKQIGDLVWVGGNIEWHTKKYGDITKFPLNKDDDPTGSIVIWEHPTKDASHGLYIAGCDPYDHDKSGTNSLGSVFIYKRFQNFEEYYDILVAEYTGRPATAEDYYENVRKLLTYYNARMLYENERKGIFVYFSNKHCDYLLADQPDILKDIIKNSSVQRGKGIHMNTSIKDYGEGLIKEWLNTEYAPGKKYLENILSEPLLEELINYNDKGNFDRVIALMMIMLYRLQLHNLHVKKVEDNVRRKQLFDSPLFGDNYYNETTTIDADDVPVYTFGKH